jgi:hypothetical protein
MNDEEDGEGSCLMLSTPDDFRGEPIAFTLDATETEELYHDLKDAFEASRRRRGGFRTHRTCLKGYHSLTTPRRKGTLTGPFLLSCS